MNLRCVFHVFGLAQLGAAVTTTSLPCAFPFMTCGGGPFSSAGRWIRLEDVRQNTTPLTYFIDHLNGDAERYFNTYNRSSTNPFREAVLWEWQPSNATCCPLSRMTRNTFCLIMWRLCFRRVMFAGDSTSLMQFQSLWRLLDVKRDPGISVGDSRAAIKCLGSGSGGKYSFLVQIVFIRNDHLDMSPIHVQSSFDRSVHHDWMSEYMSLNTTTLLVWNVGHHYKTERLFRDALEFLGKKVVPMLRNRHRMLNDNIFFRTNYHGHEDCTAYHRPFVPEEARLNSKTRSWRYNWKDMKTYNDIVRAWIVSNMEEVPMHILDVYEMTSLRPDGHVWGTNKDCLHYSLPGVVDWWNHLLASELLELLGSKSSEKGPASAPKKQDVGSLMLLQIMGVTDGILQMEVSSQGRIVDLMQQIEELKPDWPIATQKIIYNGKELLDNEESLTKAGIQDGSIVFMAGLKGVTKSTTPVAPSSTSLEADFQKPAGDAAATSTTAAFATTTTLPCAFMTCGGGPLSSAGEWIRLTNVKQNSTPLTYSFKYRTGNDELDVNSSSANSFREMDLWEWQPSSTCCPLSRMTRSTLCFAMERLGLRRVMIAGDSTSLTQFHSLWRLLDMKGDPGGEQGSRTTMECWVSRSAAPRSFQVRIVFVRNDHMDNGSVIMNDDGFYKEMHHDWISEYTSRNESTLLVWNYGLHVANEIRYKESLVSFEKQALPRLRTHHRMFNDYIFFRTNYHGHDNCMIYHRPFLPREAQQYTISRVWKFSRQKIKSYNDIARTWIVRNKKKVPMHILDVYDMAALRPDGQIDGEKNDCLHYKLPGIVDWWNHLLVSELLALSRSSSTRVGMSSNATCPSCEAAKQNSLDKSADLISLQSKLTASSDCQAISASVKACMKAKGGQVQECKEEWDALHKCHSGNK